MSKPKKTRTTMKPESLSISEYITLTEKVTKYVRNFMLKHGMTKMPELWRIAKRFGIKQVDMLVVIEDCKDLMVNVGWGIEGGGGCAEFDTIGEYLIEDLSNEIWREYERRGKKRIR